MSGRRYNLIDQLVIGFDQALGHALGRENVAARETPGASAGEELTAGAERRHVAGLMRVNHAGEVCAQALYQGQGLTAKDPAVKAGMQQSAAEEIDHLVWCEQRLRELDSHTSVLNPLWYLGSFTIGAFAGLLGDKWSLGFVTETERQVVRHLQSHLEKLPPADAKSRRILEQMKIDEGRHATIAMEAGAAELPPPVKTLMRLCSKIMTTTAYYL